MKKLLFTFSLLVALCGIGLPLLLWWSGFQASPLTTTLPNATDESLKHAKNLIVTNTTENKITLSEQDINALLQYGLNENPLPFPTKTQAKLTDNGITVFASINSGLPFRPFINVSVDLTLNGNAIIPAQGTVGTIPINRHDIRHLIDFISPYLNQPSINHFVELSKMVRHYEASSDYLTIHYQFNPSVATQLQQTQMQLLFGEPLLKALTLYQRTLHQQFAAAAGNRVSLATAIPLLFEQADQRTVNGNNPIIENQAALMSLALHSIPTDTIQLLGIGTSIERPQPPLTFTLENRRDLAQHFLTSAMMTLLTNKDIANAAGLYKELFDNHPAGFDVTDLIADRTGSLFAELATKSKFSARLMQERAAAIEIEAELFPPTHNIKYELEDELLNRFESEEKVLSKIENAIDSLVKATPLYRGLLQASPQ